MTIHNTRPLRQVCAEDEVRLLVNLTAGTGEVCIVGIMRSGGAIEFDTAPTPWNAEDFPLQMERLGSLPENMLHAARFAVESADRKGITRAELRADVVGAWEALWPRVRAHLVPWAVRITEAFAGGQAMYNCLAGRPHLCTLLERLPAAGLLLRHADDRAEQVVGLLGGALASTDAQRSALASLLTTYVDWVGRGDRTWTPEHLTEGFYVWAERIPLAAGRLQSVPTAGGARLVDLVAELGDRLRPDDLAALCDVSEWTTFHQFLLGDGTVALAYLANPASIAHAEERFYATSGLVVAPERRRRVFLQELTGVARRNPDRVLVQCDLASMATAAGHVVAERLNGLLESTSSDSLRIGHQRNESEKGSKAPEAPPGTSAADA